MVTTDELWIGDWLEIISSGTRGQYHGMDSQGLITIRTKDHILTFVSVEDVKHVEDEVQVLPDVFLPVEKPGQSAEETEYDFGDIIDLHYDVLIQTYPHQSGSKLEYQLNICTRFIQNAIQSRLINIQIIHGRGQGILKTEVERLLKQHSEITIISSNPNLASVDAWMNYH